MKYRAKEFIETIAPAQRSGDANPSANDGENGQERQWNQHDSRAFMDATVSMAVTRGSMGILRVSGDGGGLVAMRGFKIAAVLAEKREEP